MTWKARIAQVRDVPAGQTVGYGRTWKAPVDSRVAVLPLGYHDGYPRALSGRAHVLIHGQRAPLCGRICMNLCMVDVTRIDAAAAGDEVVLLGRQGDDRITVEQLADWLGTIAYEVLTLPRSTWQRMEAAHA
jgi:alanine racemase